MRGRFHHGASDIAYLAFVLATLLSACVPSWAVAQTELPERGDSLRAAVVGGAVEAVASSSTWSSSDTLIRPRAKPPTDWVDVVEFPLKMIGWPLELVLIRFPAWLVANVTAPRPPSFLTRAYRDISGWGFKPVFHTNIGPRSNIALEQRFTRFDPFYIHAALSERLSQRYRTGISLGNETVRFASEVKWQRDAERRFHGVGSQTRADDRSFYRRDWWNAMFQFGLTASSVLTFSGNAAYERNDIGEPIGDEESIFTVFATDSLYGMEERTEYAHFSFGGTLDLTSWDSFQQRGMTVGVDGQLFVGLNDTESDFRVLSGFVNTYLPLSSLQSMAFRAISRVTRDDGSDQIPFYHLSTLGGSRSALGFPTNRFADNDMVSIMSEYRFEVWRELHGRMRAETFLFYHYGAVGESIDQLRSSDWHPSYGVGLRLSQPNRLLGLAYLGVSREGITAGIRTSWPF